MELTDSATVLFALVGFVALLADILYYLPAFVFVRPNDTTASRTVLALNEVIGSVPKETTRMIMIKNRICPPIDRIKSEREKSYAPITISVVFILMKR